MLKIIAGDYRSRRLLAPPDDEASRPYTGRAREAVFNLLRGWFEGARVLDLFAGVGTIGLEALSRGAEAAVMVELDRCMHRLLEQNIEDLGCGDRATAVCADALGTTALLQAPQPVDVVFIDPPYRMMREEVARRRILATIERCRAVMADESFLVLRSPLGPETGALGVDGFAGPEGHRYGVDMWVLLYSPGPDARADAPVTAQEV